MQLSIGTNWDPALLEALEAFPEVVDLYGSLPRHEVGHGRPYASVPKVKPAEVEAHLAALRKTGRTFTYTLNAPSMGGRQFDAGSMNRVLEHVQWIADVGADFVVTSIPALVQLVKTRFPSLKVKISHNAMVLEPEQARLYQEMGADMLTAHGSAIRYLDVYQELAAAVNIPVQVICTANCVRGCPNRVSYHSAATSMLSSTRLKPGPHNRHATGYCFSWCHLKKLEQPEAVLKSGVRPEDLHFYEAVGIDNFKLDTRVLTTQQVLDRVRAYTTRRWEGDLKRLFSVFSLGYRTRTGTQMGGGAELPLGHGNPAVDAYFSLDKRIDFDRLAVDNKALAEVMAPFVDGTCVPGCHGCTRCGELMEETFDWDPKIRAEFIRILKDYRTWVFARE